jgi:hypothetical protein
MLGASIQRCRQQTTQHLTGTTKTETYKYRNKNNTHHRTNKGQHNRHYKNNRNTKTKETNVSREDGCQNTAPTATNQTKTLKDLKANNKTATINKHILPPQKVYANTGTYCTAHYGKHTYTQTKHGNILH